MRLFFLSNSFKESGFTSSNIRNLWRRCCGTMKMRVSVQRFIFEPEILLLVVVQNPTEKNLEKDHWRFSINGKRFFFEFYPIYPWTKAFSIKISIEKFQSQCDDKRQIQFSLEKIEFLRFFPANCFYVFLSCLLDDWKLFKKQQKWKF